jgi:peptidoglycan hydrolase-like protein with peptidoglycan-binding domain
MAKNKYLPYVIFGLPILIGGFFLYKYVKSKKTTTETPENEEQPNTQTGTTTSTPSYTQQDKLPFKKGSMGGYVRAIQRVLGITQDGKFGKQTEASVKAYQKKLGLVADGIVGAKTWNSLFGADFPNEVKKTQSQINQALNPNAPDYARDPNQIKPISAWNPTF